MDELANVVGAAGLAELVWRRQGEAPGALGVVPLALHGGPAVALPWSHEAVAREVAAAPEVALVLSEPRLAGPAWRPAAVVGRARLIEDGDGALFREHLLDQELRKHPPARALMDSFLLQREHWWYLPRLVLLLQLDRIQEVRPRQGPRDAVLAVDEGRLQVAVVRVEDWDADDLALTGAPDAEGPAALVGQEVSVPDAERWTAHVTTGRLAAGRLAVRGRPPSRELEPVPGLRQRIRRQRDLERSCVRALRAAGHG
jgi:hypothetical protein